MTLHTELPIYKKGVDLLSLAVELWSVANSYLGLLRQATHSHHDRATFANAIRKRGHCINAAFTKAFSRPANP